MPNVDGKTCEGEWRAVAQDIVAEREGGGKGYIAAKDNFTYSKALLRLLFSGRVRYRMSAAKEK